MIDHSNKTIHQKTRANITLGLLYLCVLIIGITSTTAYSQQAVLSDEHLQHFCEGKSIWLAFGIESSSCTAAAKSCAQQPEFHDIDPKVLNEKFYHCVFKKLDIDIDKS